MGGEPRKWGRRRRTYIHIEIYMKVNRYLCITFRSMCENGYGCSGSEMNVLDSERMMGSIGL